jgi:predicted CxxxxCH...CXXCH cytochrome family protein
LTVSNTVRKNIYTLNNSTTVFSYTFALLNTSDLHVYLATGVDSSVQTEITSGFTINTTSKTVTYSNAANYGSDYKLVLLRITPLTQSLDLVNQGSFYAQDIENSLDKLTDITQELTEASNRSVIVPVSSSVNPNDLLNTINSNVTAATLAAVNAESAAESAESSKDTAIAVLGGSTTALEESTGYGVISGLDTITVGMMATVHAGIIHTINGYRYSIDSIDLVIPTANTTNPRIDLIYISATGAVTYLAGTPSVNPVVPTLPTNGQGIANITVAAGAITGIVTDIRIIKYNLLDHSKNIVDPQLTSLKSTFTKLNGFVGINGGVSGVGNWITSIGIRNVRLSPFWASVESVLGVYNFTGFDAIVANAKSLGEKLYIGLDGNNTLYGASSNSTAIITTTAIAAHLAYVTAVATRYAGNGYMYSFWNEPDSEDTDHYYSNPTIYVNMVKDMYNAIKSVDPTAIVCMPDAYGPSYWFAKVCELGLLDYTDAVSIHLYSGPPENVIDDLHRVRTIIRRYTTSDIPIYITEFGFSSAPGLAYTGTNVSESTRAKYIIRYILCALASRSTKVFIYTTQTARSNTTSNQDWFGILDTPASGGGRLPVADALAAFMNSQINSMFIGRQPNTNKDDYIMKLMDKNTNMITYAVWTTGTSHAIILNGASVMITDTVQIIATTNLLDIIDTQYKTYDSYGESVKRLAFQNEIFNDMENNISNGTYNHSEGSLTQSIGDSAHAQNSKTLANTYCHSEGIYSSAYPGIIYTPTAWDTSAKTITVSDASDLIVGDTLLGHSSMLIPWIGVITNISGLVLTFDIATNGYIKKLVKFYSGTGYGAHAEGISSLSCAIGSHSQNVGTIANVYGGTAMGIWNKPMANGHPHSALGTSDLVVVGNGSSISAQGNAFRITANGAVYALSAFNSSGADYAEYFEWQDLNLNKEDRVGYFVSLEGEMIRKSNSTDNYLLGIVSSTPSVIGDSQQDDWSSKYDLDDWGRIQYNTINIVATIDSPSHIEYRPIYNSKWDSTKEYIPREQRPEWSPVGMMGKLLVRDDGTCVVDGYCKSNDNGIATTSTTGYRVIKRVSTNIIQVVLK